MQIIGDANDKYGSMDADGDCIMVGVTDADAPFSPGEGGATVGVHLYNGGILSFASASTSKFFRVCGHDALRLDGFWDGRTATAGTVVSVRVDMRDRSLAFRVPVNGDDWLAAEGVTLPAAVRPWVWLPARWKPSFFLKKQRTCRRNNLWS